MGNHGTLDDRVKHLPARLSESGHTVHCRIDPNIASLICRTRRAARKFFTAIHNQVVRVVRCKQVETSRESGKGITEAGDREIFTATRTSPNGRVNKATPRHFQHPGPGSQARRLASSAASPTTDRRKPPRQWECRFGEGVRAGGCQMSIRQVTRRPRRRGISAVERVFGEQDVGQEPSARLRSPSLSPRRREDAEMTLVHRRLEQPSGRVSPPGRASRVAMPCVIARPHMAGRASCQLSAQITCSRRLDRGRTLRCRTPGDANCTGSSRSFWRSALPTAITGRPGSQRPTATRTGMMATPG